MWVAKPLGRGNHLSQTLHLCILFFLGVPLEEVVNGAALDVRRATPMGKEELFGAESDSEVEWDVLLWLDALREGLG